MFGRKKQKKNEGGTMAASVQQLVEALKNWKAAVEQRDNMLRTAYAEIKGLGQQVKTVSDERDTLKNERDTLKKEKDDLQQQLDQAKKSATDPPPAPQPET